MSEDLQQELHGACYEDARPLNPPKTSMLRQRFYRTESGAAYVPRQAKEFYPQAARCLLLAVINQAISDVLENEGEAEAAEQWLSSRDFDSFVEPLGCGPEVFRHRLRTLFGAG